MKRVLRIMMLVVIITSIVIVKADINTSFRITGVSTWATGKTYLGRQYARIWTEYTFASGETINKVLQKYKNGKPVTKSERFRRVYQGQRETEKYDGYGVGEYRVIYTVINGNNGSSIKGNIVVWSTDNSYE